MNERLIFRVEQRYEEIGDVVDHNKQNDRVYARSSYDAKDEVPRVQRGHDYKSIMAWWELSPKGATHIHFSTYGVKISAKIYEETILEPLAKIRRDTLFTGEHWIFKQVSAPAHKSEC